jgi:hypothetical protein
MFEPRIITNIAYAVRQASGATIPTSANIGIPQVLKGPGARKAVMRTLLEIEAKAAQEALGLATAMDVGDGRANIIKFEVDGLRKQHIGRFVQAVKGSIRNSRQFQNHRVIASCLELDRNEWKRRRSEQVVIEHLLNLNEFYFVSDEDSDSIDLNRYFEPKKVRELMAGRSAHPNVRLNDPSDPSELGLDENPDTRLKFWVEALADAGADGVMIDTPIQAKVAGLSLLVTETGTGDTPAPALPLVGTFSFQQLKTFSEYCAYHRVECWLAGSIQPDHAARLAALPDVDVIMCRGAASENVKNPYGRTREGARSKKRISVSRVAALAECVRAARR